MERRELICIGCPLGCSLRIEIANGKALKITGNNCKVGEAYAEKECTNPTRIVTSSIKVLEGNSPTVSVKTASDIPKAMIFECIEAIKKIEVKAPVKIGDVILKNVADTGVDIIATKNVELI